MEQAPQAQGATIYHTLRNIRTRGYCSGKGVCLDGIKYGYHRQHIEAKKKTTIACKASPAPCVVTLTGV